MSPLVIVHDLYVMRIAGTPPETNPPLIIDPDAVLTGPVALQRLKPIAWWDAQEFQGGRSMNLQQLPVRHPLYIGRKAPTMLALKELLRLSVREALDHPSINPQTTP
jgi:hypothetical protein